MSPTGGEYKRGGARFPYPHDDGGEALWVVLRVTGVKSDVLQVQLAAQCDRRYDVPGKRANNYH